jgi:hypothetical protein
MWFELLDFAIGIGFGYAHRGTEAYVEIIRNGVVAGIVMSILLVGVSVWLLPGDVSTGAVIPGIAGLLLTVLIFVVIFVMGTIVGDKLECLIRK